MSDNEAHKGKLIPMVLSGVKLEERCKSACKKFKFKKQPYDTWEESLRSNGYRQVIIHDRVIYKVEDQELDPYGFSSVTKHKDGTLDYAIMYYNGGASFDEVLEEAVKRQLEES